MKPEYNTHVPTGVPAGWLQIASDLRLKGYSVTKQTIDVDLCRALREQACAESAYKTAGIGRSSDFQRNQSIRTDEICWIERGEPARDRWLVWSESLRVFLNRELLLGLFSFECHFAHYAPGGYYSTHRDAFRGQSNRILSVVLYLNENWDEHDGGQLLIYPEDCNASTEPLEVVLPEMGTVAVFLSEEFPHEVKPAKIDRYSIAGWYRVNTTTNEKVDPPR